MISIVYRTSEILTNIYYRKLKKKTRIDRKQILDQNYAENGSFWKSSQERFLSSFLNISYPSNFFYLDKG